LDVQEMARARTPQAIEALTAALNNPRERVAAAIALLDRGWGKPKQPLSGDGERPVAIEFTWASALDTDNEGAAPAANPVTIDAEREDVADTGGTVIVWKGRQ
jgi:hypothetical protein